MLLKFIFLIVILYFIFVAIRNLARAVMADSHAARIERERGRYYGPPPRPQHRAYQESAPPPRPRTTIHVRQQPVRREDRGEDVEDAKFRGL